MAYFAADNVISWLSTPLLFYPVLLLVGAALMVQSMGLGHIATTVIKETGWIIARRIGIDKVL